MTYRSDRFNRLNYGKTDYEKKIATKEIKVIGLTGTLYTIYFEHSNPNYPKRVTRYYKL
jgi:hypothetical protein